MQTDLVIRASRGDQRAFGELAKASIDRLYAVAQRIVRDHGVAEDVVQQALLAAWQDLPTLREPERFEGWLYRLLVRIAQRELGRRKRWQQNAAELADDQPAAADGRLSLAERDELERAFRQLSAEQRAVLILHHYAGYQLAEIAAILALPAGTVRSRLHYGHQALRASLEADRRRVLATERQA